MAVYYLDTSAVVKRYVGEVGTAWVTDLYQPAAGNTLNTARITCAELIAALFRRVQAGSLALADAQTAAARFRSDLLSQYELVEITENVVNTAMRLAETHMLRGYDAVQLAAALELQAVRASFGLPPLTFVSADDRLNKVAAVERLPIEDPNLHP